MMRNNLTHLSSANKKSRCFENAKVNTTRIAPVESPIIKDDET